MSVLIVKSGENRQKRAFFAEKEEMVKNGREKWSDKLRRNEFSPTDRVARAEFSPTDEVARGEFSPTDEVARAEFSPTDRGIYRDEKKSKELNLKIVSSVLELLPKEMADEIKSVLASRKDGTENLCEIRLRAGGVSTLLISSCNYPLMCRVDKEVLKGILLQVCHSSIYAYNETLKNGYVPFRNGVRVGVCGFARYENSEILGVCDFSTLVFRLPLGHCSFATQLASLWRSFECPNLLICSECGGGKTTALREFVKVIGSGESPLRVCVADERLEFIEEEYSASFVDLLRGYSREKAIELAYRTLSAQVIAVDEITTEKEALAVMRGIGVGAKIIATAHAQSVDDLQKRVVLLPLLKSGAFPLCVFIKHSCGKYSFEYRELNQVK